MAASAIGIELWRPSYGGRWPDVASTARRMSGAGLRPLIAAGTTGDYLPPVFGRLWGFGFGPDGAGCGHFTGIVFGCGRSIFGVFDAILLHLPFLKSTR